MKNLFSFDRQIPSATRMNFSTCRREWRWSVSILTFYPSLSIFPCSTRLFPSKKAVPKYLSCSTRLFPSKEAVPKYLSNLFPVPQGSFQVRKQYQSIYPICTTCSLDAMKFQKNKLTQKPPPPPLPRRSRLLQDLNVHFHGRDALMIDGGREGGERDEK